LKVLSQPRRAVSSTATWSMLPLKETRSGCQLSPDCQLSPSPFQRIANFLRITNFRRLPFFGLPAFFGLPTFAVFLSEDCQAFSGLPDFRRISLPPVCQLSPDCQLSPSSSLRIASFLRAAKFLLISSPWLPASYGPLLISNFSGLPSFGGSLFLQIANFLRMSFSPVCQLFADLFPFANFLPGVFSSELPTFPGLFFPGCRISTPPAGGLPT
jgi:hypothetical protein